MGKEARSFILAGAVAVALVAGGTAAAGHPALSPDGTRLLYSGENERDLTVLDLATGERTLVACAPGSGRWASWSPDGRAALLSTLTGDLLIVDLAGGRTIELGPGDGGEFTPDGRYVVFSRRRIERDRLIAAELVAARADGSGEQILRAPVRGLPAEPALGAGGGRLAFASLASAGGAADVANGRPGEPPALAVELAVTLDDLPFVGGVGPGDSRAAATGRILAALGARAVPVTGFVVGERIAGGRELLAAWLAAGADLGNHSQTHTPIDRLDEAAWEADVAACQAALAKVLGRPPVFYRFPCLQSGRTPARRDAARTALARLGLRPAPVSVDTGEWVLVKPYLAALERGDRTSAEAVLAAYVEHVAAALEHYREVARERGGETRQVLLLHANILAADGLPALLARLEAAGCRFVALERALADPVYDLPDRYAGPIGLSWLYRVAGGAGQAWRWDDEQLSHLRRRFDPES